MKKKFLILLILSIVIIGIIYGIIIYFNFFQGKVYVKEGTVNSKIKGINYVQKHKEKTSLDDCKITKANDINIYILGDKIPKDTTILLRGQRYYLPLNYVVNKLGYKKLDKSKYILKNSNKTIKFNKKQAIINNKIYNLRGWLLDYKSEHYISISDIEYLFQFTAIFNFKNNSIELLKSKFNKYNKINRNLKDGKGALIRLEDFSIDESLDKDINQIKLKALGDYLYNKNIKFHIAWVPRYKNPSKNIDNDILNNNIKTIGFVNLIDYLINSGGEFGLHGYTHQYGESPSLIGTELSHKFNNSEKETRKIIEKGLFSAYRLNIPISFFESPHYQATRKQKNIVEEYFKYLFEPYSIFYYTALKETDKGNIYVPTPLGYVENGDISNIVEKIKNPTPNLLISFFYHPVLELKYIEVNNNNNIFSWSLEKNSNIKSIISSLNENGYSTIHVTDIK